MISKGNRINELDNLIILESTYENKTFKITYITI